MAFGKNPHVPRAEAAELKATDARDPLTRERALRDAAHQWDRAAEREKPGRMRETYLANATRNREQADGAADAAPDEGSADEAAVTPPDPLLLN
jgi:hypothetical protein